MTSAEIAARVLGLHLGEDLLLGFGEQHVLPCRPVRPDAKDLDRFWVTTGHGIVNIRLSSVRGIYLGTEERPD